MKKLLFLFSFLVSMVASGQIVVINQHTTIIKKNGVVIQSVTRTDSSTIAPDTARITTVRDSLIYRDTCLPSAPINQAPTSHAGTDQTVQLPANSITIAGSGTDPDGTIAGYVWSKVSGPSAGTIINATSSTATFSGLAQGTYTFRLTVIDDKGAPASDDVNITVLALPPPPPPTGLTGYGTILSFNGFENGLTADQKGRGVLDSVIKVSGKFSFLASVNQGDPQISSGWRSEQNLDPCPLEGGIEFDVRVDQLLNNSLIWQCHGETSGTSGVAAIWIQDGNFMTERSDEHHNNVYQTTNLQKVPLGVWVHFRIEWKFASSGGYFHVIQNGVQSYAADNVKTNDVLGQYLKIGINEFRNDNGSTAPGTEKVHYDNVYVFGK